MKLNLTSGIRGIDATLSGLTVLRDALPGVAALRQRRAERFSSFQDERGLRIWKNAACRGQNPGETGLGRYYLTGTMHK